METLMTICIIVAVIGLVLVILGAIGPTAHWVPYGVQSGIGLIVVGVVLYIILALLGKGSVESLGALAYLATASA